MDQERDRNTFIGRFEAFLRDLESIDWKKMFLEDYKSYNIKQYSIEKLSTRKATELYRNLVNKLMSQFIEVLRRKQGN